MRTRVTLRLVGAAPAEAPTARLRAVPGHGPAVHRCLAPWAYEFPVSQLVQSLKYEGALANARVLGTRLVAQACARSHAILAAARR